MDKSFLYLEYSGWWILLILLISGLLSYLLYAKKSVPWSRPQNIFLGTLRFLGIAFLGFLLLSPSIRRVVNEVEKPVFALAIDNSQSVIARGSDQATVDNLLNTAINELTDQGIEVVPVRIADTSTYSAPTTNLSELMRRAEDKLKDRHFSGMILASDGIFNRGNSPLYHNYLYPVFALGLGDTIPPKDISISRALFNQVTYKGNETPIRIEVTQNGYENREVTVQLKEKGVLLEQKKIRLRKQVQEVIFTLKSEAEGLRHITAHIVPMAEESTTINNVSNIFMEVIDGRKRVLIVASAPHPDIRAIRTTLDQTGNYETEVYIPDIQDDKPTAVFDVVIFHGAFTSGINFTPKENPGRWYMMSNESSITSVNKNLSFININRRGSRPDKVAGSFNQNFSKFKIEDVSAFEEYPPVEVPFGEYSISGPVEVLMYQKLGNIKTQKPLMTVFDDGSQKIALTMGQNIWQWKLQESAINENADQFDNLITKTVQFLSVTNDQKQFRFKPRKANYTNSEPVLFDAEAYNDIYERTYGNDIEISITSENGTKQSFNFIDSEYNPTFQSPFISPGVYKYRAATTIGGKRFTDQGEFAVQEINPEYVSLTADHLMLQNLTKKSGGLFKHFTQSQELFASISERDFKSKIKSVESFTPIFKTWWWYLVIFLLFSGEWILRKYWGGY